MADNFEQPDTPLQETGQPTEAVETTSKARGTRGISESWIGGGVWLVAIAIASYFWFYSGQVDVLLNVSGTDPLVAEGVVAGDAPVASGTIQVLVEDPQGDRLLASAVTDVTPKGTFRIEFRRSQFLGEHTDGLRVRGDYHGRTTAGEENKVLKGTSTVYVNMTPPWGMNWGFSAVVFALGGLVVLFTGPLGPRKARVLFGVTYVFTFSACVIPIVLTVAASRSPALVDTMRRAPVGILNAKAKGLEEAQWLVNIGGSVNQISTEESGAGGRLLPTGTRTAVVSIQTPPTNEPSPGSSVSAADTDKIVPDVSAAARADNSAAQAQAVQTQVSVPVRVEPRGLEIKGGLAIPLYVIVLAMLGAGINMTRKVPQIQTDYDSSAEATWSDALSAPLKMLGMSKSTDTNPANHSKNPSLIRQELIETYMYFLSAPFLAVAVYYLLQIVASSVAEPVLVVIAFASGLMSELAVRAIVKFADDYFNGQKDEPVPAVAVR